MSEIKGKIMKKYLCLWACVWHKPKRDRHITLKKDDDGDGVSDHWVTNGMWENVSPAEAKNAVFLIHQKILSYLLSKKNVLFLLLLPLVLRIQSFFGWRQEGTQQTVSFSCPSIQLIPRGIICCLKNGAQVSCHRRRIVRRREKQRIQIISHV